MTNQETVEQYLQRGGRVQVESITEAEPQHLERSSLFTTQPKVRPRSAKGVAATAEANKLWAMRQPGSGSTPAEYKAALDAFVHSQHGLCGKILCSFLGHDVREADLQQAAVVGLLTATARWVPGRGASFAGWARWAIRDALRAELRATHMVLGKRSHGRPTERLTWMQLSPDDDGDDPNGDEE